MEFSKLKDIMLNKLGINNSSVLLPKEGTDMQRWSVVACDQYTSEPEYWQEVDKFVGSGPSTLRLIFPEVYLESESDEAKSTRIHAINQAMERYIKEGLFIELKDSFILVERTFKSGRTRHGLVLSVDLERYDYAKGSQSLIRATEGTIIERLPPRIRIRENASLELPHIMLLIDDRERSVIEPLVQKANGLKKVYDFTLMMQSGSIKGWQICDEKEVEHIVQELSKLADARGFKARYGLNDDLEVLLFAVGDGNHSLATAKSCWDNLKKDLTPEQIANHPARFALVEVVNVHDEGLEFEPIHRVLFNVDHKDLSSAFGEHYARKGCKAEVIYGSHKPETDGHAIEFVTEDSHGYLVVECPVFNLDVGTLQDFLDEYLKANKIASIDYVHGRDVTERLGKRKGNMGFFLSPMAKEELFRTVILDGALPRKTFSMGEASEKRFYLESRKLR